MDDSKRLYPDGYWGGICYGLGQKFGEAAQTFLIEVDAIGTEWRSQGVRIHAGIDLNLRVPQTALRLPDRFV